MTPTAALSWPQWDMLGTQSQSTLLMPSGSPWTKLRRRCPPPNSSLRLNSCCLPPTRWSGTTRPAESHWLGVCTWVTWSWRALWTRYASWFLRWGLICCHTLKCETTPTLASECGYKVEKHYEHLLKEDAYWPTSNQSAGNKAYFVACSLPYPYFREEWELLQSLSLSAVHEHTSTVQQTFQSEVTCACCTLLQSLGMLRWNILSAQLWTLTCMSSSICLTLISQWRRVHLEDWSFIYKQGVCVCVYVSVQVSAMMSLSVIDCMT